MQPVGQVDDLLEIKLAASQRPNENWPCELTPVHLPEALLPPRENKS